MSYSARTLLITSDDAIYRLPGTTFARMLADPQKVAFPRFAGQRIRLAELVFELSDRRPVRIARCTYSYLSFDAAGRPDINEFGLQQASLVDALLEPTLKATEGRSNIIKAKSRFLAQGATWTPSQTLQQQLTKAALGQVRRPDA